MKNDENILQKPTFNFGEGTRTSIPLGRKIFLPGACIGHGILHQEIQRSPGNQDVSAWNATCNQRFFVIFVCIMYIYI